MTRSTRAVVLLSGGLDSATTLALARARGRTVVAVSFAYGQRHDLELRCARAQARAQGVARHHVIDLSTFGSIVAPATSLLRASPHSVPREGPPGGVPNTYVPARNTLFLAYGLAVAEAASATEIWIGANAVDYSGYPDCRPDFLEAFERVANLGTKAGRAAAGGRAIRIEAPLLSRTKAQIVTLGIELGVDFAQTFSCYDPAGDDPPVACGTCPSCRIRLAGFARAGHADPIPYADPPSDATTAS